MKSLWLLILAAAEDLSPGYFALVMAMGIVSIACHFEAVPVIPAVLVCVNWVAYGVLCLLTLIRLVFFPEKLLRAFLDHLHGPGFFTLVAGTSVLGAQTFTVEHAESVAIALWYLTVSLWCLFTYPFFIAMTIVERKAALTSSINGGWLIAVVATQSIVVLGGAIGGSVVPSVEVQFLCLVLFLIGGLLYILIITLIFYRLVFLVLSPKEFDPLYWIDMGGAAISVLAGATLILRASTWPILEAYLPFLRGMTIFFWAAATWWIPFLVAMTIWTYLVRKDNFRYEPALWGMVFPLGMYASATFELIRAERLAFLGPISRLFMFAGLGLWLFTFCSLIWHFRQLLRKTAGQKSQTRTRPR
jgi:tellurite resistance protein TehA-like permease